MDNERLVPDGYAAPTGRGGGRILVAALLVTLTVYAEDFSGRVVGVVDGDTITVLVGFEPKRVRLAGIDAPEKGQAFGQRAKQATSRLVFGRTVRVVARGEDRYGRTLGDVRLPDGSSLNERLVEEGWAWHYARYSKGQRLAELEATARRSRRGLWVDPRALPPWEFRNANRR